ncbi:MAG: hypothetical protein COU33_02745 [Candidatus Magasanikbacteria bacterium CG10_big_fil_rev_8_21_14_0_10_43_6]|uniref:DUF5673 domain-containing protein n=1 Tax=Candidatus Magasanikbacteria bacterium CG10_big_fil_rev_8_21_14_0_10_43_6 TaxID=1974650 RepID=A0A2M6W150_9BACT|nr:MAG: hypothetical protein COU33_02745 [Candidatus Magasanikbacteria bacterium CG10_big_fil_rev_8_21_14_0_10_43_6]
MPQQVTVDTLVGDTLYQWTIKEYEEHTRGKRWYIVMSVVGVLLVLFGLLSGNFLFSLIIMLFAIILYLQSHQKAPDVLVSITDLGVLIGSRFYSYGELESFYLIYEPPHVKSLFFETQSVYRPRIQVPLLDMNPIDIRKSLLSFLQEDIEKEQEPFSEQFARNWQIH